MHDSIYFAGKEYKYFMGEICNKNLLIPLFSITLKYCKEFYQKVADLLEVEIQTKFLDLENFQDILAKKTYNYDIKKTLFKNEAKS